MITLSILVIFTVNSAGNRNYHSYLSFRICKCFNNKFVKFAANFGSFFVWISKFKQYCFSCIDRSSDENAKADLWTSLNELNPGGGNQITFGIICYIIWIHRRVQHTFFSRSTSETGRANKIEWNKKQRHFSFDVENTQNESNTFQVSGCSLEDICHLCYSLFTFAGGFNRWHGNLPMCLCGIGHGTLLVLPTFDHHL